MRSEHPTVNTRGERAEVQVWSAPTACGVMSSNTGRTAGETSLSPSFVFLGVLCLCSGGESRPLWEVNRIGGGVFMEAAAGGGGGKRTRLLTLVGKAKGTPGTAASCACGLTPSERARGRGTREVRVAREDRVGTLSDGQGNLAQTRRRSHQRIQDGGRCQESKGCRSKERPEPEHGDQGSDAGAGGRGALGHAGDGHWRRHATGKRG